MKVEKTILTYGGVKGEAMIVQPEKAWKLVCWQKAQYVPCWDIEGLWVTSEWFETAGTESEGHNFEPIHDKECRFSRVKVLESGKARVIFQWNYALTDTLYKIFHGDSRGEERFCIYPGGYTLRKLTGWPGKGNNFGGEPLFWEVGELICINPRGTLPVDNIEEVVATYMNTTGQKIEWVWSKEKFNPERQNLDELTPLCKHYPEISNWSEIIIKVHLKERPSPFLIIPARKKLFPHPPCSYCQRDHPPLLQWYDYSMWSHWPLYEKTDYKIVIRARKEDAQKRPTHTSIVSVGAWYGGAPGEKIPWNPKPGSSWYFLFGVSDKSDEDLISLAFSWLNPARIRTTEGLKFRGYDYSEMAYIFELQGKECSFELSSSHSIFNPVFIIKNWRRDTLSEVTFGHTSLNPRQYRWMVEKDSLIIWIDKLIEKRQKVRIS